MKLRKKTFIAMLHVSFTVRKKSVADCFDFAPLALGWHCRGDP